MGRDMIPLGESCYTCEHLDYDARYVYPCRSVFLTKNCKGDFMSQSTVASTSGTRRGNGKDECYTFEISHR